MQVRQEDKAEHTTAPDKQVLDMDIPMLLVMGMAIPMLLLAGGEVRAEWAMAGVLAGAMDRVMAEVWEEILTEDGKKMTGDSWSAVAPVITNVQLEHLKLRILFI